MKLSLNFSMDSLMLRAAFLIVVAFATSGCVTYEYHDSEPVRQSKLSEEENLEINEDQLLDVGIVVFDPGIDLLDDDSISFSNVRQSEAVWFASQLKNTMQASNIWGSVRTMPEANTVLDIEINGKILESNGEVLKLQITAKDATGQVWFDKKYARQASRYAYSPEVNYSKDPFNDLFVKIANDLFDYRLDLSQEQAQAIRDVSSVRFARDFAPEAFDEFLDQDDGEYNLLRAPAANDPMILRVEKIKARNDLFLDVIQDYYRSFNRNMAQPYQEWRKSSYKEVLYERQLKQQSRNEKLAGVAAILAGILAQTSGNRSTRTGGHIGIFAGVDLIRKGYAKQEEALLHSATVRELGAALEAELEPSVIDLEDRSVTLSGTVDEQFNEWRRILAQMFLAEQGEALEGVEILENINVELDQQTAEEEVSIEVLEQQITE